MFSIEEILKATQGELIHSRRPNRTLQGAVKIRRSVFPRWRSGFSARILRRSRSTTLKTTTVFRPGKVEGLINGSPAKRISGVSIDSRTIHPGELFVAIKGTRFDGHSFIAQAMRRRAAAVVFSAATDQVLKHATSIPMVRVQDTRRALGALARYHRARFKIPVVAITGSNGKTTTKEMASAILALRFNVWRNPGTQNNLIGVSLAILRLRKEHNLCVIEIGANHKGEIAELAEIIQPTLGIITNIGPSHLEFFQHLQGVFNAKMELLQHLPKGAKIIVNKDDQFLSQLNGRAFQIITFGLNRCSDFRAEKIMQTKSQLSFLLNGRQHITLKILGRHNVYNALAAIACARSFGLTYRQIKMSLACFQPAPMRMQIRQFNKIKLIVDCYNSNPGSLSCAVDFLREYPSRGRKIVVCGDMLELGKHAEQLHLDIGRKIAQEPIDFLVTVGSLAGKIAKGAVLAGMSRTSVYNCADSSGAGRLLQEFVACGDTVLIKGSRAMKMENIVTCFTNSFIR